MKRLINLSILLITLSFCAMFGVGNIKAQTITATLSGTVFDPNGAIVQGATVTVTSNETGLSKNVVSNADGRYTITFLQPGTYNIKVEKQGFAETTTPNIKLETGQSASLNLTLQVTAGQVAVDISSDDQTQLLNTESSSLDTTIENKLVEDLPTGERSALAFVNLVPGTIDAGFAQARGEGLNENGNAQGPIGSPGNRNFFDSNFSVNGGRSSTNDVLLDGVSNTVGDFNGVAVSPPQDSIREFKVVAGSYPAEYGRSGGGVVSISTKSGGKRYNGALYEYYQDGNFNANGWQRNRRGLRTNGYPVLPRVDILRHQYGGTFGGPMPFFNFGEGPAGQMFKKLDKTFFFFNYEGRYEQNPFSKELTLPTARMRTGDLGEVASQIYNPYIAGRPAFAGNNISTLPICTSAVRTAACLDPVALEMLKYIPLPNQPGLTLNYIFDGRALFRRDVVAFRLDHTFSENHSFFARMSYEKRFTSEPNFFEGSVANNVRTVKDTFLNLTFNDTYAVTSTLINNFRYGFTRVKANQIPESFGFDPVSLGLPAYMRDRAASLLFPELSIGGASNVPGEMTSGQIGGSGNINPRDTQTVANAITYLKGNHTMRFGGEYRLLRYFNYQYFDPTGSFTFSRNWTATTAGVGGSAMASFLLGLPNTGSHESVIPLTLYHHYGGAFFQDDWRITNRLVLNLGVRWDFETGTGETHNLMSNFDLNANSPLQGSQNVNVIDPFVAALNPNVRNNVGLLSFVEGGQTKTNKDRFAPRLGFAFKVNDKTTVRGGYGLFYVPTSIENPAAQGVAFSTNIPQVANTTTSNANLGVNISNPFPAGIPAPPGTSLGSRTRLGQAVIAVEPVRKNPYNQQWNIVVQRELAKNTVIDLAYVGSHGVHLPIQGLELNEISDAALAYARQNFANAGTCPTVAVPTAACASVAAFFTQQVANPFTGLITTPGASTTVTNPTVQRLQLLRRFPQYTSVNLFRPHLGSSKYHAMQINLQRRFTNGLSATANYTWSKSIDTGGVGNGAAFLDATAVQDVSNFPLESTLSTLDVPHRFVASWSYELPIGKRKKFGSNWNGLAQFFLGGWQTSGSFTVQSGAPIPITVTNSYPSGVAISGGVRRPNRVAGSTNFDLATSRNNTLAQGSWFDPNMFIDPIYSGGTLANNFFFGNSARTHSDVRRDNYRNVNLSVLKNWYWAEGKQKFQLRAEFLNAFNWVVYGTPVSNLNITGAVGSANNNTLNSANPCFATQQCFGQVRTQGNTPRNMQFVARYSF